MSITKVVVAGGGVLGSQIAFQAAYKGFDVTIWLRSDASIGRSQPKIDRLHGINEQISAMRQLPPPLLMPGGPGSLAEDSVWPPEAAACACRQGAAAEKGKRARPALLGVAVNALPRFDRDRKSVV